MLNGKARGAGMAHLTSFKPELEEQVAILSTGLPDSRTIKRIFIIVFLYGRYLTINGMTIHVALV